MGFDSLKDYVEFVFNFTEKHNINFFFHNVKQKGRRGDVKFFYHCLGPRNANDSP